jgi:hypothetical protein
VPGELITEIRLNQLKKFVLARTRFGAVGGRVRDANAVESIKLIRPSRLSKNSLTSRTRRRQFLLLARADWWQKFLRNSADKQRQNSTAFTKRRILAQSRRITDASARLARARRSA